MLADLDAADKAGDAQLAQHIAGQIKAARVPRETSMDRLKSLGKEGAHFAAKAAPVVGGIVGGVLGAGAGGLAGAPSGPGAVLTSLAGGAAGAGLLSAAGKSVGHSIDTAIGYEDNPGIAAVAKDSLKTGAQDAAATAIGGAAVPIAMRAAGAVGSRAAPLLDLIGNRFGRRVLSGGATPLTVKAPLSPEALDAAHEAGAFKPWGTTRSAANAIEGARETTGAEYGRIVRELEAAGVQGPDIPRLAQEYLARGASARANTLNPAVPRVFDSVAEQLQEQARVPYAQGQGPLALGQSENMKRSAQGMAKSAYQQMLPTELGDAHTESASMIRQAVEDAVERQSYLAPRAAADFVPIKQRLGPLIEAGNAADRGAVMADRKHAFSLIDLLAATAGGHGDPLKSAGVALGSKALRTFGPSAATWALKGGANVAGGIANIPASTSRQAGAVLGSLAGQGDEDESAPLRRLLLSLAQQGAPNAP